METFNYKVQLYVKVWQEVELTVNAQSKEEADAMVIQTAKDHPLSLDNGDENIEINNTIYLCDTESLVDNINEHSVEVYSDTCEVCIPENALYTNRNGDTK